MFIFLSYKYSKNCSFFPGKFKWVNYQTVRFDKEGFKIKIYKLFSSKSLKILPFEKKIIQKKQSVRLMGKKLK